MAVGVELESLLAAKFEALFPHLNERQRRLVAGAEARSLGHGGIRVVARAAGMREGTVSNGVAELESGAEPLGRVRRAGGGRKKLTETDPTLLAALLALVEPQERGDPMSPLRWTVKSVRTLADHLTGAGHRVSSETVAQLLRGEGFSLQGNAKTVEGAQSPYRDAQFRYINEQAAGFLAAGDPVVSVDAKKKELVGNFANRGRTWRPQGEPIAVNDHDFPDEQLGKVVPYGIYDVGANTGWVNVGVDHDTAAFAVESIRRWWNAVGRDTYPQTDRLLITADAGGSNAYRTRAWKRELAAFALEAGLTITVCHFPPGTSKWNKIEHRLFSAITMNWRGRPLTSHEVVVRSIAATTTRTGLRVLAELDTGTYPTKVHVSKEEMIGLPLTRHTWQGAWNYTLRPEPPAPPAPKRTRRAPSKPPVRTSERPAWAHPALTGMPAAHWDQLVAGLTTTRARGQEAPIPGPAPKPLHPGGRPQALAPGEQALVTALRIRFSVPRRVLADLFAVTDATITAVERRTRPELDQHGYTFTDTGIHLNTFEDLATFAGAAGLTLTQKIKPAR
jgi:Rhodopirellula transposase DDE domain